MALMSAESHGPPGTTATPRSQSRSPRPNWRLACSTFHARSVRRDVAVRFGVRPPNYFKPKIMASALSTARSGGLARPRAAPCRFSRYPRAACAGLARGIAPRHGRRGAHLRASRRSATPDLVARRLAVPRRVGDTALGELVLLHLSILGRRQVAHEFEIARHGKIGQARFAEHDQLEMRERLSRMQHDSGHHLILAERGADREGGRHGDRRVTEQNLFDLE